MKRAELLALPEVIDIRTAAQALGIGQTKAYEMARTETFPVKVLRVGNRYRIVTENLLKLLEVESDEPTQEQASTVCSCASPHLTDDQLRALPPLMSLEDVAPILDLAKSTAYALAKTGDLPVATVQVGARMKIRRCDLLEFLGIPQQSPPREASK
jgi:predicted DNA-binding transcriptional regulator AlpA